MKRKISVFLTLISSVSLIVSGCGASTVTDASATDIAETGEETEIPSGDVSLRVWGAEEDADLLNTIATNFKAEYGDQANFEITIEAVAESDCRDSVLNDVNNAADVFTFADDQLSTLAASGVLKPVDYNLEDVTSRNSASSVSAASVNDSLYAYPLTADNGYFLYYNKQYFSDEDLATLDGILSVCASNGKKMTMDATNGWYLYSFYGNTGLTVGLNSDGISNYCTWNGTDGDVTGVQVAQALMSIAGNSGFENGGDDALTAGAQDGSVIAGVSGTWLSTSMAEIWGDDLGACKLPTYTVNGNQIQMSSYAGYKMVGVNAYSANYYWAEVFADFMTNEENQTLRFESRGQGPSNTVAASSEAVSASVAITALISQSEFASLQRIGANYWTPASELGAAMMAQSTGGVDLQEFLDNIVAEITASNS